MRTRLALVLPLCASCSSCLMQTCSTPRTRQTHHLGCSLAARESLAVLSTIHARTELLSGGCWSLVACLAWSKSICTHTYTYSTHILCSLAQLSSVIECCGVLHAHIYTPFGACCSSTCLVCQITFFTIASERPEAAIRIQQCARDMSQYHFKCG